jgi:hypothetical protein
MLVCSGLDDSSDGEAPAGGGGKLLVLDWFPVAGYRWRVGSPAALDVLSDKVQKSSFMST